MKAVGSRLHMFWATNDKIYAIETCQSTQKSDEEAKEKKKQLSSMN